jgi:coenzyme F420-0:L-glutamate ligase/coenzyme F420-1:gamma-L-glutamate ligase
VVSGSRGILRRRATRASGVGFPALSSTVPVQPLQIFPLGGLPEIAPGDRLGSLIVHAVHEAAFAPRADDIFVVAQKIVSKAEGRLVRLDSVEPSQRAAQWATQYGKDPRLIELVLQQTRRIVRMERGVIVAETRHGFICANAGVDASNVPEGTALVLPEDPDRWAQQVRDELSANFGVRVAVIVSDTFGRPWREGLVNVALGVAGIPAIVDYRGQHDTGGKLLSATIIAVADEIASAAELVMGKTKRTPVAIVRGVKLSGCAGTGRDLLRPAEADIFR